MSPREDEDKEPKVSLSPSRPLAVLIGMVLLVSGVAVADTLITASGSKYEGTVTQDGDTYLLIKPDGSKMTFPKSMVAEVQRSQTQPATEDGTGLPASVTDGRVQGDLSRIMARIRPDLPAIEQIKCLLVLKSVVESSKRPMAVVGRKPPGKSRITGVPYLPAARHHFIRKTSTVSRFPKQPGKG